MRMINFKKTQWTKAALGFCLILSACSSDERVRGVVQTDEPTESELLLRNAKGTAGLMNFRQTNATIYAVTKLDAPNGAIQAYMNENMTALSLDGNAERLGPAMMLKTMEVMSLACQQFIAQESSNQAKTTVFEGLNLTDNGQNEGLRQLDDAKRATLIQKLAELWWQRSPTPEESAILADFIVGAGTGVNQNNGAELRTVLMGACTLTASAAPSIAFL